MAQLPGPSRDLKGVRIRPRFLGRETDRQAVLALRPLQALVAAQQVDTHDLSARRCGGARGRLAEQRRTVRPAPPGGGGVSSRLVSTDGPRRYTADNALLLAV